MRSRFFALCTIVCASASPVGAQATFEGCQDVLGVPVASVVNPALTDVALSTMASLSSAQGPQPVIYFQSSVSQLPTPLRRVIYFHECGHHALGHVAGAVLGTPITMAQEQVADCWAIVHLVESGEFHLPQVQVAQAVFGDAASGLRMPGPPRSTNFVACLALAGVQPLP